MMDPQPRRRGFAALDPQRRRAIASSGGRARRDRGASYSITRDNARALAESRWNLAGTLADSSLGRRVGSALQSMSIAALSRAARISHSTLRDALAGRRITKRTASSLMVALDAIEREDER
ncbi:MAG: hypothetical protein Q8Q09_02755 [Deltaproteobacteria bacterium]|nr:hypothetical protein [Deltaproteobacteria bacterium]